MTCEDLCETPLGVLSVVWRLFKVIDTDTDLLEEIPTDQFENMTQAGMMD